MTVQVILLVPIKVILQEIISDLSSNIHKDKYLQEIDSKKSQNGSKSLISSKVKQ